MEPCHCGCTSIGLDVSYAEGAAMFCPECGHRGPRVSVSVATLYADQLTLATTAWNESAETGKLQSLAGGYDDLRFSA
jgi:hypothetical protein